MIVELVPITLNLVKLSAPYALLTPLALTQQVGILLAILVLVVMDLWLVVLSAAPEENMSPCRSRRAAIYAQLIHMDRPKEAASNGKSINILKYEF